ncbi:hypothetical protein FIC_02348 [Flavobacteriaceae bacterium 3519-10]|nr:hypothetical protein FIC_02348 [Flavobacteriaceae bacterium 3519-10]
MEIILPSTYALEFSVESLRQPLIIKTKIRNSRLVLRRNFIGEFGLKIQKNCFN